ncbi:MAG: TetR/AcrR family transcriptional regulator [Pseudomonadota bacterium]
MSPRIENPEARKDKETVIFDAACRVIREKGFHQARMADIAAAAGISYGLVYHYYKSKSDLFDALSDQWWDPLEALVQRLVEEDRPVKEKLLAVADYHLDQFQERPDLVHVFIMEISRSTSNLTPERLGRFKKLMALIEIMMTKAQAEGSIRKDLRPRYLTYFFLGSLETFLSTMVLDNQPLGSKSQKKRLAEAVVTIFFEGAGPNGA